MNRLTIIGLVIVAVLVIVALFAPWIATLRRRRNKPVDALSCAIAAALVRH